MQTPIRESLSQIYHFVVYKLQKPRIKLKRGMVIISIDLDVGSRQIGLLNRGKNDANVNFNISEYEIGKIEELALPFFIDLFDKFEIPVTIAVRGQLTEVNTDVLKTLVKSGHDVGSHGYYHRDFTKMSYEEAKKELNMISDGMRRFGITPKSFIFPHNNVAHLNLLEEYGYKCYRERGGFLNDGMYIEKRGQLYDVHPSYFLGENKKFTKILKKMIDISAEKRLPLHFWFHLWNFGQTEESILKSIRKLFLPFFRYAKKKVKRGNLEFETMLSAAEEIERYLF